MYPPCREICRGIVAMRIEGRKNERRPAVSACSCFGNEAGHPLRGVYVLLSVILMNTRLRQRFARPRIVKEFSGDLGMQLEAFSVVTRSDEQRALHVRFISQRKSFCESVLSPSRPPRFRLLYSIYENHAASFSPFCPWLFLDLGSRRIRSQAESLLDRPRTDKDFSFDEPCQGQAGYSSGTQTNRFI